METIKKMRDRHRREIKELQSVCKHLKSTWVLYEWAPGHCYGDVRVCGICDKILERHNLLTVSEYLEEDKGKERPFPC